MRETRTKSRFLILKIGALGDLVFAHPAIRALKSQFPNAQIDWIVGRSVAQVLQGDPEIARVLTLDDKKLFNGTIFEKMSIAHGLRKELAKSYDGIFIFHRDTRYSYLCKMLTTGPIFQVARENQKPRHRDHLLQIYQFGYPPHVLHESMIFKDLITRALSVLDHPVRDEVPLLWDWNFNYLLVPEAPGPSEIASGKKHIVFHLGGGKNLKTEFALKLWPHWSRLITSLLKDATGNYQIVLVGAPSEAASAEEILAGVPSTIRYNKILSLVGKTSLTELFQLLSKASGFVGVDSGPLHVADALGVPCIGLYGATSHVSWGLLRKNASNTVQITLPCSPCYKDDGHFPTCPIEVKCMRDLSVEEVSKKMRDCKII